MSQTTSADWMDRTAIAASLVCLVHCLVLPLVVIALPLWADAVPDSLHAWLLAGAVPLAMTALVQGRTRHRTSAPLMLGIIGLTGMTVGVLLGEESPLETPATVVGALCVAAAHIGNWRRRRICCR